jgi:hypothetical protein
LIGAAFEAVEVRAMALGEAGQASRAEVSKQGI